ncbi:MAG TPA: anhydro-N-acetylmuramic acid kinase [Balneolaceae bacterium]
MNPSIQHLTQTASKETKIILGLMSGTSTDGLDLALCEISGSGPNTNLELLAFKTEPYSDNFKKQLQRIISVESCNLQEICLMNTRIGDYFGEVILKTLKEWGRKPDEIDCIASHGQTVYHAPVSIHQINGFPNATLQLGDGDHIARKTGILTLSDFRQKHTAAGGEGAPLVAPIDRLLFTDDEEYRLLLNIGGIANFTYLPPSKSGLSAVTTDTGPGNTLLDATARELLDKPFDANGKVAASGKMNEELLTKLKDHKFFTLDFPKTTGPELFNRHYVRQLQKKTGTEQLSTEDLLATLTLFSAHTIVDAIRKVHQDSSSSLHIYLSGGGMHNSFLISCLKNLLENFVVQSFEKIGFNPDAKEAVCFAVLANETLSGDGFLVGGQKVNFGKISFPD